MTDDDTQEPQTVEEEWAYLGPHPSVAGGFRWRDASGEILAYKKTRGRVFGGLYTMHVDRSGERITLYGDARFTGRKADDAAALQVRALAIERELASARLEKNTSRTAALDEAIAPLVELAAGLKSMTDRRALGEYVLQRIYRAGS